MARSRVSMQELIRQRRRAGFVGRREELRAFRANFEVPPEDDRHRFLFHVHGPAGVGKTSLVREMSQLATGCGAFVAYVDEATVDVPAVSAEIAAQFAQQGRTLKALERAVAAHRRRVHELTAAAAREPGPDAPSAASTAMARAGVVGLGMVPVVGALAGVVDAERLAHGADRLRARLRGPEDPDLTLEHLVLAPERALTPVLLDDLDRAADTAPWLVLFFDTYERTAPFLDRWLHEVMTTDRHGELPANVVVVTAGQRPLDPARWDGAADFTADLPLRPFTETEARDLLTAKGVTDEPVVTEVLRLSGRLPVLVSTLAESGPAAPDDVGDPSATAVERFLKWEQDPVRRTAALDCALPRRLDEEIVRAAAGGGGEVPAGLDGWLRALPFVRADRTGAARYHDVVRAPMLRLRRTTAPALWSAGHTRIAGLYARRRAALEEELRGRAGRPWMRPEWRALRVEELYHLLCAGPRTALPGVLREGIEACRVSTAVARAWARAVADAAEDADAEHLRVWADDCRAVLGDERTGALGVLDLFLARPGLDDAGRVAAYNVHGLQLFRLGRLREALRDHERAIALDPADPWGHHGLAVTYRALGEFDTALRHLDDADEVVPGAEWVARDRGETYRRMGRPADALPWLDRAHAIDPSEPLTLGSRGQAKFVLGRPHEALADLDHALALWPDYPWALARRAHIRHSVGDLSGALADLDRAEELEPDTARVHGERGDVLRFAGRLDEALAAYDAALALDPGYAWAWGSRALALEALGRTRDALASLAEALRIDPEYGWAREQRERIAGQAAGQAAGPATGPAAGRSGAAGADGSLDV
ncbi:tetratricopeptide repeat protein [Streptomyces sp. NPDC087300]|uniref:tetratricopeptide repeat protein n=1 Tax=Streptomyces sp. NPDC087300 TaxID=3365780 RepID=UPI003800658D